MGYWSYHPDLFGLILLGLLMILPRFSLFGLSFFGTLGISFFGFIGWITFPRLTIAIIATDTFWQTNRFLCIVAWISAGTFEFAEKLFLRKLFKERRFEWEKI